MYQVLLVLEYLYGRWPRYEQTPSMEHKIMRIISASLKINIFSEGLNPFINKIFNSALLSYKFNLSLKQETHNSFIDVS